MKKIKWNAFFIISVVIVIAYWQIAFFQRILLWDSVNAVFPARFYSSECIRMGLLPFWLPYQYTGIPFFSDPQSSCWYPVTWLLSCFGRYNIGFLSIEYILSIMIAGYGMYQLTMVWVKDKHAAIFASICYICCGVFVGNAEHLTIIISATWLPWLFWSYHRMVFTYEVKYAAIFAILVLLLATGGYPAFLIISFYIFILLFVIILFNARSWVNIRKIIGLHVVLILLSVCCCIIVFYSFSKGMLESTRSGGVSLEMALLYPFSPSCFLSFLLPFASFKHFDMNVIDPSMTNGYFGLTGLIFLILSFFQKKDMKFWVIFVISLFCLASAVGNALPIRTFLYNYVPMMNLFRFPSIFRLLFIIGSLLLAAGSFKNVKENYLKWKKIIIYIILALIAAYLLISILSLTNKPLGKLDWNSLLFDISNFNAHSNFTQHTLIQSMFQIILLCIFLWLLIYKMKYKLHIKYIIIICVVDLISSVQFNMYGTIAYHLWLRDAKQKLANCPKGFPLPNNTKPINENFDEKYWGDVTPVQGNTLLFKKVLGIDGYNPYTLQRFDKLKKSKLIDSVWYNPPAYFANNICLLNDTAKLNLKNDICVADSDFNLLHNKFSLQNVKDSIYFNEFGPNRMSLHTRIDSGSRVLVLQQNNLDEWVVAIDGIQAKWFKTNIAYMGVLVSNGEHNITYEYKPTKVLPLLLVSISGLVICLFIILFSRFKTRENI